MIRNLFIGSVVFILLLLNSNTHAYAIDIEFDSDTYGQVNQAVGVIIPATITSTTSSNIRSTFPNHDVWLKVINPTTETIQSSEFSSLYNSGYSWYFSFTDGSIASAVLAAYLGSHDASRLVVEIDRSSVSQIASLKQSYPSVKFYAGNLYGWDRSAVNEILTTVSTPIIEGISFRLGFIDEGSVYEDLYLMFATLYDASKTIAGEEINFPPNTTLSVNDVEYPSYDHPKKSSFLTSFFSSTIVSSVQSTNTDEGPIRFANPGVLSQFNSQQKYILAHFARFMSARPQLVWPMAIRQNGDPWYNPIFDESDTVPIVGIIGQTDQGYYGIMTNIESDPETAELASTINLTSGYTVVASDGNAPQVSGNIITIAGYDTIMFYPTSIGDIPLPGDMPTDTPTDIPTESPVDCSARIILGDLNCDSAVTIQDFTYWSDKYLSELLPLKHFEYFRRAHYDN